jgi:hypothetical protein
MSFSKFGVAAAFAVAVAGFGCSSSSEATGSRCTRDDALLDERKVCRADDDCPCGAHCTLGQCTSDCRANSACPSDTRCDDFGRCRSNAEDTVIPPLSPAVEGALAVTPRLVPALDPGATRALRIEADTRPIGNVRVVAEEGLEVACDADKFAAECRLADVPALETRIVTVRRKEGAVALDERFVRIYAGTSVRTVSIGGLGIRKLDNSSLLGTYRGTARAIALGVEGSAVAEDRRELALPVTAEIVGGLSSAVISLHDESATLHPKGTWTGGFTIEANRSGTIRFPTYALASGQVTSGAPYEVLVEAADAPVRSPNDTTLAFDLRMRYRGVLPEHAPTRVWRVVLERSGGLAANVTLPVVPADARLALDTRRGRVPTPWETALPSTFTAVGPFLSNYAAYESIRRSYLGTEAWIDACGRSDLGRYGMHFFAAEFGDPATTNRSHVSMFVSQQVGFREVTQETITGTRTSAELEASPNVLAQIMAKTLGHSDKLSNVVFSNVTTGTWDLTAAGGSLPDGEIPCGLNATGFMEAFVDIPGTNATFSVDTPILTPIDRCQEAAARYGCTVQNKPELAAPLMSGTATGTMTWAFDGSTRNFSARFPTWGQRIVKVCKLPPAPRVCDAAVACYVPPASDGPQPRASMVSSLFGSTLRDVSGELECAQNGRSAASPLDENGELASGDPLKLTADVAEATCRDDLEMLANGAPPTSLAPNGEGLRTLFAPARCFETARFMTMLGVGTSGILAGDGARRGGLFQRRLHQFFTTYTFLARETVEREQLAAIIRKQPIAGRAAPAPLDEQLRTSLRAWSILAHPRFAEAYDILPAAVLYDPDYRTAFVTGSLQSPNGQAEALPVAMLELLRAQVEMADAIAERGLYKDGPKALPYAREVLPWVSFVRALAASGHARALAYATETKRPPPPWALRYDRAEAALADVLARLYGSMDAIRTGKNPLGIEESDTPLYFLADAAGSGRRFSAISDYLLGDGSPGTSAWAPSLTQQAIGAIEAARASFVQREERLMQVTLTTQQQQDRDNDVASAFGERLFELCGPFQGINTYDLLDSGTAIDPNVCYVRNELPECRADLTKYNRLVRTDDVAYQVCLMHELKKEVAAGASIDSAGIGFALPELDRIARTGCAEGSVWLPDGCAGTEPNACFRCIANGAPVEVAIPPGAFGSARFAGVTDTQRSRAMARCSATFPKASPRLPSPSVAVTADLTGGTCYKGSLGEMALTVSAAAEEALGAAQEVQDHSDAYQIAVESCRILDTANSSIIAENDSFKTSQSALRAGKLAADIISNAAGAVKDCASAVGADNKFGVAGTVACGAAAVEAVADSVSDGLQFAMDEAEQAHDNLVAQITLRADVDRCFKEAKLELVGAKTAAFRAKAASLELEQSKVQLANLKDQVRTLVREGLAGLDYARATRVRPPAFDFWLDERLREFVRKMRLAKRATYLAARAVEYELQETMSVRGAILAAETPYELGAALDTLRSAAASRRIAGSAPSDLKVVLSLREQLLQLQSRDGAPSGQLGLNEIERFRLYIQQQKFTVLDDAGKYLGQRVPFAIAPLGTLAAGQPGAIAVFAKQDCAERLWSVNASIQGASLYRGGQPSFIRVDLLKSNTFYSQWCSTQDRKDPFQISSVRPSRNLFLDPQLGTDVGQQLGLTNESTLFGRARIQATFNVTRTEFELDRFENGQTSELAARGLYGNYALFFPAELLSLPDAKDPKVRTNGLDLNQIDDILLRLDYVSVAR